MRETIEGTCRELASTPRFSAPASLTVVVPTRNEASNVTALLERLGEALAGERAEVLFVDDSDDGTPDLVRAHRGRALSVGLLHRRPGRRVGGLGGAVAAGLRAATGEYVRVMDADLQHPPALVPRLLAHARASGADVVVASRYVDEGDVGQFGALRRAVSRASTTFARALFPRRLKSVTDPMSGFFLVRRRHVDPAVLRPDGFKILLEILLRQPGDTSEVPFSFSDRLSGESKACWREGLRYLRHLLRLRASGRIGQVLLFAAVGATGVAVNTVALGVLLAIAGRHVILWSLASTQVAILWNFGLSERWVFRRDPGRLASRLASYMALNNASFAVSGPLLVLLVAVATLPVLAANVISLTVLAAVRFLVCDRLIWPERSGGADAAGAAATSVFLPLPATDGVERVSVAA